MSFYLFIGFLVFYTYLLKKAYRLSLFSFWTEDTVGNKKLLYAMPFIPIVLSGLTTLGVLYAGLLA